MQVMVRDARFLACRFPNWISSFHKYCVFCCFLRPSDFRAFYYSAITCYEYFTNALSVSLLPRSTEGAKKKEKKMTVRKKESGNGTQSRRGIEREKEKEKAKYGTKDGLYKESGN